MIEYQCLLVPSLFGVDILPANMGNTSDKSSFSAELIEQSWKFRLFLVLDKKEFPCIGNSFECFEGHEMQTV